MKLAVILSSGKLTESLRAEFGEIPHSFLPLGGKRLYEYQFETLKKYADQLLITIPINYRITPPDIRIIEKYDAKIVFVDKNSSISEAFYAAISSEQKLIKSVILLYGDTLIDSDKFYDTDFISIHDAVGDYTWGNVEAFIDKSVRNQTQTLSGFFQFKNMKLLRRALKKFDSNFIDALGYYHRFQPMLINNVGKWYDFGHIQNFYRSSMLKTTQRYFNDLKIDKNIITKSSSDRKKIKAEANWFIKLPKEVKKYTPNLLEVDIQSESCEYSLEYVNFPTLASLAAFGELRPSVWDEILNACNEFLCECANFSAPENELLNQENYFSVKTNLRIDEFSTSQNGIDILKILKVNGNALPKLGEVLNNTSKIVLDNQKSHNCIIHGDFCFSNIFYDYRSGQIKVIDPRGLTPTGDITIYGPQSYDYAKLAHSIIGRYDNIIAKQYLILSHGQSVDIDFSFLFDSTLEMAFIGSDIGRKFDLELLTAMVIQLFFAMLPLHSDDRNRQIAIYCMAHELYRKIS